MSRNRIKSANSLQTHKLWKLITVVFVLTLFGLVYVFLQLKIDTLAKDNKKLELVLADCKKRNDMLALQSQRLTTPNALQRQLAYFHIDMVDLNKLQVLDAQSFRGPGEMLARGRDYPPRAIGGVNP
jgi:hypothetical protein